jgi:energy-coupling factor transporter ATP-binding protein EcfA2
MTTNAARLSAVPTLSAILARGTEGGKEFGRLVGLLLLNDAKRHGRAFNLFDDAAGDYEGLDSFERTPKSKDVIGYQYKFFPSPLSDSHRNQIRASLENALQRSKRLKLVKWVLVTPDDFMNSGRREGGGDVEWFEALRDQYKDRVEVEQIGHTKLLALFLEAPYLCLFYYPSLVSSGMSRRKNIQELRTVYDQNMRRRYGQIEFVGMSIYKEEASRRIALENIYIPISVVSEKAPDENDETPRVNPMTFLSPGAKTVILGDPGSGKSTLVSFLALVGTNNALQRRCGVSEDNRLTIVVTLRRYADELKERKNLSLLEYIVEAATADFNMDTLELSFYEYHIESGQSIVLFDGLDELPGIGYKRIIRQRIDSFIQNYPANSYIVTSRLIGYDAEIRFDDSFGHYRVAKLRIAEIQRFIFDWYAVRMEDLAEKNRNAEDLLRVITHPDSESIRTLARNPLLLTIVALVHRIDAVLPDQRVVLYQKCTETLLNTWYKAKRRDEEAVKGRVERRNRLRIESIAYWMHRKSLGEQGRSVASRPELISFLTDYINANEKIRDTDEDAEDQAEIFLEFVKNSAGLLIEAGDGLYSFIHLTFQEYLCATHLAAFGEKGGAQSIWDELQGDLQNPRWREVVRLLIASLRSISGQSFFVDKILDEQTRAKPRDTLLLLIGLLRDGIDPAEERASDIVRRTIEVLQHLKDPDDIRIIESALHAWIVKDEKNGELGITVFDEIFEKATPAFYLILALIRPTLGMPELTLQQKSKLHGPVETGQIQMLERLVYSPLVMNDNYPNSSRLFDFYTEAAFHSPETNAASAIGFCVSALLDCKKIPLRLLCRELAIWSGMGYGPHHDNGLNLAAITLSATNPHPGLRLAVQNSLHLHNSTGERQAFSVRSLDALFRSWLNNRGKVAHRAHEMEFRDVILDTLRRRISKAGSRKSSLKMKMGTHGIDRVESLDLIRNSFFEKVDSNPGSYWDVLRNSEIFSKYFLETFEGCAGISPMGHWGEALRITLQRKVPSALSKYFDNEEWHQLSIRISGADVVEDDIYFTAWLILFDVWVWNRNGYGEAAESPIVNLIVAAEAMKDPIIRFALALRATAQGDAVASETAKYMFNHPELTEIFTKAGWPTRSPKGPRLTRKGG